MPQSQYPNYYDYIDTRDIVAFDQYSYITMDNGMGFYMNDIYLNDNGDGTANVDCTIDLQAYLANSDLYADDFMVVPMDAEGNILADATKISSILDYDGYSLSTPVVLTSDYTRYTISFIVPSNTQNITFYGVNIQLDSSSDTGASASGPVYYIDITFAQ
jgi:hypothetical protein